MEPSTSAAGGRKGPRLKDSVVFPAKSLTQSSSKGFGSRFSPAMRNRGRRTGGVPKKLRQRNIVKGVGTAALCVVNPEESQVDNVVTRKRRQKMAQLLSETQETKKLRRRFLSSPLFETCRTFELLGLLIEVLYFDLQIFLFDTMSFGLLSALNSLVVLLLLLVFIYSSFADNVVIGFRTCFCSICSSIELLSFNTCYVCLPFGVTSMHVTR